MSQVYDYELKKNLAHRIEKIVDKSMYTAIINIIKTLNPDLVITENSNGLFIKFNDLANETYIKLDNYLHKNAPKKTPRIDPSTISEFVSCSPADGEISSIYDETQSERCDTGKYRLSNKDKKVLKHNTENNLQKK